MRNLLKQELRFVNGGYAQTLPAPPSSTQLPPGVTANLTSPEAHRLLLWINAITCAGEIGASAETGGIAGAIECADQTKAMWSSVSSVELSHEKTAMQLYCVSTGNSWKDVKGTPGICI